VCGDEKRISQYLIRPLLLPFDDYGKWKGVNCPGARGRQEWRAGIPDDDGDRTLSLALTLARAHAHTHTFPSGKKESILS